ncbi:uncharacterized protein LOC110021107 [Phalaenopsis equestris]|uniref:uncharacterized protein LOC110021107 n=1 Tax=Phalaenopsis equestris TaxID=78828 RepID=UPI0009E244D9|nr:uncharacterized protein LOC110021107 [Phalaenopsis equestris]XP_020575106.1 uncharacterized protein LOC110021107 [Phalaenopsis equestris]
MGEIGLLSLGWKWLKSQKQAFVGTQVALGCLRDRLVFLIDQHWPLVCRWSRNLGKFFFELIWLWRDCVVRGLTSLIGLGSTALFVIFWSSFLSLASTVCLFYVLLSMGAAGASIYYLGFTPGLFMVGLFGILILWKCSNFWTTGVLIVVGGYAFSLSHARGLVVISAVYALYFVHARVGWTGVFLSMNLSFISNDLLNKLLQGYDYACEHASCEEHKASEPLVEDYPSEFEFFPHTAEANNVASSKSTVKNSVTSSFFGVQKDASSIKVVNADSVSNDEMKRIMNSSNHYEALGFPRRNSIDPIALKKEYYKKAMLVHPDKNMGKPLASESFKKLQCAYEVLSDFTKKKNYDEQLRKEESGRALQRSCSSSRQDGVDFHSEESRRIDCTKCGHSHIWICIKRSKASARWCQDCSQYHQAKDGDGWVELTSVFSTSQKVQIPRAFVCAESKIFDVSEWASCQGMECKPNTHRPSFHVNMVGLDRSAQRSNSSRYPWGLDAEMVPEDDEFELWLQQALASGLFSDSPKRRKSWSPFKMPQKGIKPWRKSP